MHRGKLLRTWIDESGLNKISICRQLCITRPTLYRWFETEDLELLKMKPLADFLGKDLRIMFPEANTLYNPEINIDYRQKYYDILSKYNDLLEKMNALPGQYRDKMA